MLALTYIRDNTDQFHLAGYLAFHSIVVYMQKKVKVNFFPPLNV